MLRDAVAEDLGENPTGLQPPVYCDAPSSSPASPDFPPDSSRSLGTFFVRVAAVALVGLYPLARLKEVMQNFVQNFNVNYWQGKDPGSIPGST